MVRKVQGMVFSRFGKFEVRYFQVCSKSKKEPPPFFAHFYSDMLIVYSSHRSVCMKVGVGPVNLLPFGSGFGFFDFPRVGFRVI